MNVGRVDGAASDVSSGLFADTHWSLVMRAKDDFATALNSLCLAYRAPLLVWLRCRGETPEDAEDLVQGFSEHLLSYEFLRNVAREKGCFRTFLLAAFQNYLCDQHKRAVAAKRGGGQIVLCVPLLNIILCLVWALRPSGNIHRRSFCRATLFLILVAVVVAVVRGLLKGVS